MKTIIKETYELEDGDLKLITMGLDDPCQRCSPDMCISHTGCSDYDKYLKHIAELKRRNLLEVAKDYQRYCDLLNSVVEMQEEMSTLKSKLSEYHVYVRQDKSYF